jgi:hypothetical protein
MAGDLDVRERLVLLESSEISGAMAAIEPTRANVLHQYGSVLVVAVDDEDADEELARALPGDARPLAAPRVTKRARERLDETAALGLAALEMRSSDDYTALKASRPLAGEPWDTAPESTPGCAVLVPEDAGFAPGPEAASAPPTSQRLSGTVAVGLVIVEGPTAALQFSADERTTVVAETQNGLTWLGSRHPTQPITWRWDIHVLRLDVAANATATDNEARFRDPALAALGFGAGHAGCRAYAESLRTRFGTNWAFVAFFTKYPVNHFAYAFIGGPHLVMDYANDGWGPANIDRVFAHETGHVFNAPDEYSSSGCNCGGSWGYYGKPNANCQSCASGGGVDCIMRANTWAMCAHTPWHLGFPMCPARLGVQFRGTVPASATRRWFTHSWPADCHVEWTVVPTTSRSGAPQISWDVHAERASTGYVTYWISIRNLTAASVGVEARYAVLGAT